jgi:hypothetical protein
VSKEKDSETQKEIKRKAKCFKNDFERASEDHQEESSIEKGPGSMIEGSVCDFEKRLISEAIKENEEEQHVYLFCCMAAKVQNATLKTRDAHKMFPCDPANRRFIK